MCIIISQYCEYLGTRGEIKRDSFASRVAQNLAPHANIRINVAFDGVE